TDNQAQLILNSVPDPVKATDKDTDEQALAKRVTGPALQQREDVYRVKDKVDDQKLPPAVASDDIVANYTAATDAWPRMTSMITSAGGDSQLLEIGRASCRERV